MIERLDEHSQELLFSGARSHSHWLDRPVPDAMLRNLYELWKWGPTSANSCPARIVFLRTPAGKARLIPALAPMNVQKVMTAPVTAIVAYDTKFYDKLPQLLPSNPAMRTYFAQSPELSLSTAQRNSALQGAYLMIAARSLGLDCGPMSGFDNLLVDREFFSSQEGATRTHEMFRGGDIRSNFICNLGYGDRSKVYSRSPRLGFDDVCALL